MHSVSAVPACLHMLLLLNPIQRAISLSNQNSEQQACSITLSKHAWHSLSSWEHCYQRHRPEQEPYLMGKENIWSHLASRVCAMHEKMSVRYEYISIPEIRNIILRFYKNVKVNFNLQIICFMHSFIFNLFLWHKAVFSASTWSFRNHSNMLIWCSRNICNHY